MVKWCDTWYEKLDQNDIKFGKWLEKKSSTHALDRLCSCRLKINQQGIQALKQHSGKPKHVRGFGTSASSSSTTLPSQKRVFIVLSLLEKSVICGSKCGYSKQQKGILFYEIVAKSLHYFNVCFQTVKS